MAPSIFFLSSVLHDNQLTHTDLKPENILFVNSDFDVQFAPKKVGKKVGVGFFPFSFLYF
jgi:CDC-like kinase